MKKSLLLLVFMIFILSACSSEDTESKAESNESSETEQLEKSDDVEELSAEIEEEFKGSKEDDVVEDHYSAEDAYSLLKDSGLISSEYEDVTEKFEGSEGLVKALKTDEVNISEFDTEEDAARYHDPKLNSYSVKNIYFLLKKNQDNAENFVKVLEDGEASQELEASYSSEEQKQFVDAAENNVDFSQYVDSFYGLSSEEKSNTFETYVVDKEVTWTGIIADLEAISDSIVLYGKDDYNGETWNEISSEKTDMMPYVFIVELNEESVKDNLKVGQEIKISGVVGSRGDKELNYNWKLYEGELITQ
ncbi:hypothetical protein [Halobacillus litoralis]|uniref:hypothetical protein n=1 Tax=Halobacillus litoralis TaxID=45668 RepID=UPI001CD38A45|nr:hypothetical protein [Halobacillus litoralis]MCA1024447.1 hypothetical protein [Halobacillus litoralis]